MGFDSKKPMIDESCFIGENTSIIGDVTIDKNSSIWFGCTIRGDVNDIKIGKNTNIQDNSVIHVATHGQGTYIGDNVSVGHMALIHACTISNAAFIGMKAIIMDNAHVEEGAMVAAGAMITPGKIVKSGEIWAGSPAKYFRQITDADKKMIAWTSSNYAILANKYKNSNINLC